MRVATVVLVMLCNDRADAKDKIFDVPQKQIREQVNRVGILGVTFEDDWPRNAAAAAEFERLAVEWLAKANIGSVLSSAYADIESALIKEQGGWFDPQDGTVIAAKRQSLKQHARSDFVTAHQLNGLLELRVDVVRANMFEHKARWHGVI